MKGGRSEAERLAGVGVGCAAGGALCCDDECSCRRLAAGCGCFVVVDVKARLRVRGEDCVLDASRRQRLHIDFDAIGNATAHSTIQRAVHCWLHDVVVYCMIYLKLAV